MATQNIPISSLPIAIGLDGTELVPIVQNGQTVRTTVTMICGDTTGFVPLTRRINTVNGIDGGGTLQDDLTLRLNFFELATKTTPTVLDWLPMNDGSSTTPVKVGPSDFYKTIFGLTEKFVPSTSDYLVLYSVDDSDSRKIDITNLSLAFGGVPAGGTAGQGLVKQSNADFDSAWGVLPLIGGGTGTALTGSAGGIVYSTATQLEILAGTATASQIVLSGASGPPSWSTATYPATVAAGSVLIAETDNTFAGTPTPVLGVSGSVAGTIAFSGVTSGSVLVTPQAAAGTVTLTLPTVSGTIAATAAAPITLNTTTGQIAITGAALTATDDTNVTASLTGTPNAALVHATNITLGWTGQLAVGRGGTGIASGTPGGILGFTSANVIASSVSLTAGAIVLGGGASSLPVPMASLGMTSEVLHGNPTGAPTWGAVSLVDDITGILGVFNGGTGLSGGVSGGLLAFTDAETIASSAVLAANALILGGGAGAVPFTLASLGTTTTVLHGNAGGAPTFGAVSLTADVSGILPVINGGTGLSAAPAGTVLNATAANVFTATAQPFLGGPGATSGSIKFNGATSGAATISVADVAGTTIFQLPVGNGALNEFLGVDGGGHTFWASPAAMIALPASADFDTITASGNYYTVDNSSTNAPPVIDWYFLRVSAFGLPFVNTDIMQVATTLQSNVTYSRIFVSGAWTAWQAFLSTANEAAVSDYYAATAGKVVTAGIIYPSEVTVTFGATTTFDFSTFVNAVVTLTGDITTQTLTNIMAGKSGTIRFIQGSTGSWTTVWNGNFKWPGGTPPVLSTVPGTVDVLTYDAITPTFILASLINKVA